MSIRAIAFDPGRTTGYAFGFIVEDLYYIAYDQLTLDHGRLWKFIPDFADIIICESFEFRHHAKKDAIDLYPCELIGIIKLWVGNLAANEVELYFQNPSIQGAKKAYYSDARLKEMSLYREGKEHGRSAVKHLLHFFHFGAGFKYIQNPPQVPKLVEESWLRNSGL